MQRKTKRNFALITLIISSVLLSTPARADDCQTTLNECNQVLDDCMALVGKQARVIKLKDLALEQADKNIGELNAGLRDAEAKLQSPLRNPFVMTAVGVVLGILVTGIAVK